MDMSYANLYFILNVNFENLPHRDNKNNHAPRFPLELENSR